LHAIAREVETNFMNTENKSKLLGPSARTPRQALLMALYLTLAMGAGMMVDRLALPAVVRSNSDINLKLIAEAWNTIQRHYVDRGAIQPSAAAYGAISGMVDALGDTGHSAFLSPEMVKQFGVIVSGKLKGVGVEIQMKNGHVVVVAAIDGSPAQHAGLRSGDIIMSVDGRDIAGLPLSQVVERISGPVGTAVTLAILDPQSHRLRDVTIVRAVIKIDNVTWQRLPGTDVADLRISTFDDGVDNELRTALRAIQQQRLRGLILDLRNNPGGVLDKAVAAASQFLTDGNVLLVKDARGKVTSVPVQPGGLAPRIPTAVLVNGGSASGAEIVAGALWDAHRATLVGETTFGTGTVLKEFPLTDGSALLLAVEEWLTPSGHSFWHKGITPELEVPLPAGVNPLVPAMERKMTTQELHSADDEQLLRALKWVAAKIRDEHAD
jgi:carboxyl-terminal processing protease